MNQDKQNKETREFIMNSKNRTNELNTYENELERQINEEDKRQWEKRAEVWQKEEVIIK